MSNSDEDDFMSDKFLVEATKADTKPTTYAERRKLAARRAHDLGRVKSRVEREREAREEGLARNLLVEAGPSTGPKPANKALDMMKRMGFTPGQALGRNLDESGPSNASTPGASGSGTEDDGDRPRLGLGAGTSTKAPRTEPLEIHLRAGRKGLGTEPPPEKRRRLDPNAPPTVEQKATTDEYVHRTRDNFDDRRAEGILRGARRTCEELDRRKGIESSLFWLDPREVERDKWRKIRARRMGETVSDDSDDGDDRRPIEFNDEEVDLEDESGVKLPPSSRDAWLQLDAKTRLQQTLDHLRHDHFYCLWCGTQYASAEDLASECPGEAESDH